MASFALTLNATIEATLLKTSFPEWSPHQAHPGHPERGEPGDQREQAEDAEPVAQEHEAQ